MFEVKGVYAGSFHHLFFSALTSHNVRRKENAKKMIAARYEIWRTLGFPEDGYVDRVWNGSWGGGWCLAFTKRRKL